MRDFSLYRSDIVAPCRSNIVAPCNTDYSSEISLKYLEILWNIYKWNVSFKYSIG